MKKSELKKLIIECLNEDRYEDIPEEQVNAAITSLFEMMREVQTELISVDKKASGGKNKANIMKQMAIAGKAIEGIKKLMG